MTEEQTVLLAIKGSIADMPPPMQDQVFGALTAIRSAIAAYPGGAGQIAIALVAAEIAAQ
ncbi:hypothetical protein FHW83_004722 [Duganella sp. SG902]|uniref:hypothetical protein n=1 Tax=Duganella sp. SG902 TaxID=2587016 RepID=UPI00159D4011|nr:hypothetical protein [Duganella sp. SG902]NVM78891.1 hypothetical protein [Duganella sp. SG902]